MAADRFFLLGPTASGKTAVGVELARRLDAEILSLDSMLVYRGLDIATAKPSREEQGGVPHHLMDLVGVDQAYSVAAYREAALAAEAEVRARGRRVLYVGGTTMWLRALVHGLVEVPPVPAALEAELDARWEEDGGQVALRDELQAADPEVAARLHPHDKRRHLRALGTYLATGRPLGAWQGQWRDKDHALEEPALWLDWPREQLHARLEARLEAMEEQGLVEEVAALAADPGFGPTAAKAIGVSAVLEHLAGDIDRAEAMRRTLKATKVLVRRQSTWLRRFPDLVRLEMRAGEPASVVAGRAAEAWAAHLELD